MMMMMILKQLEEDGLQIQDCLGQAFDNVAVMAGYGSRVQKRIADQNPRAVIVCLLILVHPVL